MEKLVQTFEDGEVTLYKFANNNTITIVVKKIRDNEYIAKIKWKFENLKRNDFEDDLLNYRYKSHNMAKINEVLELYMSLKKHKNKSKSKKLLIAGLIQVINDIKQEIYFQQSLF